MLRLVLASESPRRKALLEEWGIPFVVGGAGRIDESAVVGSPRSIALELAHAKAVSGLAALGAKSAGAAHQFVVIGADTVVDLDGEPLGKAADREEARRMIVRLSGRVHRVTTGVALARVNSPIAVEEETAEVEFRSLGAAEIERYLDTGDWKGKAGAYGIQSEARGLVGGFRGCYTTIVGLPVVRLLRMLRRVAPEIAIPPLPGVACFCVRHPLWIGREGCR